MATPHVTGVAALLKAQDPGRDWRALKNLTLAGGDNISSMTDTISQKRLNANGALSCSSSIVLLRLRPITSIIKGSVGQPIDLAALHNNCGNPNGDIVLTVGSDRRNCDPCRWRSRLGSSGSDGIYSGQWTPSSHGTFTLTFPSGDIVTVTVTEVNSITPNPIDLSSPPASFTITGGGFADLGFSLPVVNFTRNGVVLAPACATFGNSTILTVRFSTDARSIGGPRPGLSAGAVTVQVYNQTGSNSWSLLGITSLTVKHAWHGSCS